MMGGPVRAMMALVVFSLIVLGVGAARAQVDLEVSVSSGDQAPGTPPGAVFDVIDLPAINAADEIAFRSTLTGAGVTSTTNRGVWGPDGSGGLSLVARTGERAPGTPPDVVFAFFQNPLINDAGDVAFIAILTGPGVTVANNRGIWGTDGSGALALLARTGDQAPGTPPGAVFRDLCCDPAFNGAGDVVFFARLGGTGVIQFVNDQGIWGPDASGTLSVLARTGDPAPGMPAGVVFGRMNIRPAINTAGQVAFTASVTGPGIFGSNNRGIWGLDASGILTLLARTGDQAPGVPPGVVFRALDIVPGINSSGAVAFQGQLAGPGVTLDNDRGIWGPDASGALNLLAREGDLAPGTPPGVVFSGFSIPVINAAGDIAFLGFLTGTGVDSANDRGIWVLDGPGTLGLLARTGDPAPGTPPGVVFRSFGAPSINAHGDVAVFGILTGAGVTGANNRGIWGPDASGSLNLVARTGDVIELSPGTNSPVITAVSAHLASGDDDGRPSGLSDRGRMAVVTTFADGRTAVPVSIVNSPPVANAGEDRIVACTAASGTPVTLDGSGSSDPEGARLTYLWAGPFPEDGGFATGVGPTVTLSLGDSTIALVVNDGLLDSVADAVTITVQDATPPGIIASLPPVGEGDEVGDDDEGRFRVAFSVTESCDPAPTVEALLIAQGCPAPITVVAGQQFEYEREDEDCEVEYEDGLLEIEAPDLTLSVTARDAAGNSAMAEVSPTGLGADNDDDTDVASADDDD